MYLGKDGINNSTNHWIFTILQFMALITFVIQIPFLHLIVENICFLKKRKKQPYYLSSN